MLVKNESVFKFFSENVHGFKPHEYAEDKVGRNSFKDVLLVPATIEDKNITIILKDYSMYSRKVLQTTYVYTIDKHHDSYLRSYVLDDFIVETLDEDAN